MLPGLDGSGELFAPLADLLAEQYHIVVGRYPDLPGFDDYVEHAASLLPAEGPVCLLAESFSGPLAIELLARHRPRIVAAVLSATFAVSPRPLLTRIAGWPVAARFTSPPLRRMAIDLFGLNGGDYPAARTLARRVTGHGDPAALRHRAAILHRVDVSGLLPAIDIPVLCLRASRDRVVPAAHMAMLAQGLANARLVDVDAPHLLLQCRPRECAELIHGFLR
jgi:pimeloyl-[acyl-carrier protein] methyl ester esterase